MKNYTFLLLLVLLASCSSRRQTHGDVQDALQTDSAMTCPVVKYATGFIVRDSAGIHLLTVGKKDRW